jgi:hypothetical protein
MSEPTTKHLLLPRPRSGRKVAGFCGVLLLLTIASACRRPAESQPSPAASSAGMKSAAPTALPAELAPVLKARIEDLLRSDSPDGAAAAAVQAYRAAEQKLPSATDDQAVATLAVLAGGLVGAAGEAEVSVATSLVAAASAPHRPAILAAALGALASEAGSKALAQAALAAFPAEEADRARAILSDPAAALDADVLGASRRAADGFRLLRRTQASGRPLFDDKDGGMAPAPRENVKTETDTEISK